MVWIVDQLGAFIDKDGLSLIEAHAVLLGVRGSFPIIPLEVKCAHVRSVTTM